VMTLPPVMGFPIAVGVGRSYWSGPQWLCNPSIRRVQHAVP